MLIDNNAKISVMPAKPDTELVATVLLEAIYARKDEEVASKFGITARTLRNYRKRLTEDSELASVLAQKKKAFDEKWAEQLPSALRSSIDFIASATARAKDDPNAHRNPMLIDAIARAMMLCAEVHFTGRLIDARLPSVIEPENDFKN